MQFFDLEFAYDGGGVAGDECLPVIINRLTDGRDEIALAKGL